MSDEPGLLTSLYEEQWLAGHEVIVTVRLRLRLSRILRLEAEELRQRSRRARPYRRTRLVAAHELVATSRNLRHVLVLRRAIHERSPKPTVNAA